MFTDSAGVPVARPPMTAPIWAKARWTSRVCSLRTAPGRHNHRASEAKTMDSNTSAVRETTTPPSGSATALPMSRASGVVKMTQNA